jgi:hypothetical protein
MEKYPNGDSYVGEFHNNAYHGRGKFSNAAGTRVYVGQWTNGQRHGKGVETIDTLQLHGSWSNNLKEGEFVKV